MTNLFDRDSMFAMLDPVFGHAMHGKRVLSLSLATLGMVYT